MFSQVHLGQTESKNQDSKPCIQCGETGEAENGEIILC
jgi:hypothetical protein